MVASNYFIEEMHQIHNSYHYIYIENVTGDITFDNNKWIMVFKTFIVNNFNLPVNSFTMNLETTSQKIEKLPMILESDNKDEISNDSTKVFKTECILSTGNDSFFNEKQENVNYSFYINFNLNNSVINSSNVNVSQEILDKFYNEMTLQSKSTSIKYSNSLHVDLLDKYYDHIYGYYLDLEKGNSNKVIQIYYEVFEFKDLEDPIQKLIRLSCSQNILVKDTKIKINYSLLGDSEIKEFEQAQSNFDYIHKDGYINYEGHTLYDFQKNDVIDSGLNGINGFLIPYDARGTIEVITDININNSQVTYYFKNSFNFIKTINDNMPTSEAIRIDNIDDFRKVNYE